jgi:hypothetical protein
LAVTALAQRVRAWNDVSAGAVNIPPALKSARLRKAGHALHPLPPFDLHRDQVAVWALPRILHVDVWLGALG